DKDNSLIDNIKIIQHKNGVKISTKHSRFKEIKKIKTPAIIFDNQDSPFILAKSNKDKCLIQRPNKEAPEVISYNELNSIWNHKWIEIKQPQSRFD
ncbi:cysteine peptidase family C39 domain-containing protein, partial [Vibrio splendidus]